MPERQTYRDAERGPEEEIADMPEAVEVSEKAKPEVTEDLLDDIDKVLDELDNDPTIKKPESAQAFVDEFTQVNGE